MARAIIVGLAAVWWLSGCGRDAGLRCEDQERYVGSQELAPIQIPDDLDAPDDTEALRIPDQAERDQEDGAGLSGPCTESPPEFYEAGLPS